MTRRAPKKLAAEADPEAPAVSDDTPEDDEPETPAERPARSHYCPKRGGRRVQPTLRLVRLGRMRLVPVRELERWLDENAQRTLDGAA